MREKNDNETKKQDLREKYVQAFELNNGAVLEDLKRRFFYDDTLFMGDEVDALSLARREGNREVVLWIMQQIEKAYKKHERRATRV